MSYLKKQFLFYLNITSLEDNVKYYKQNDSYYQVRDNTIKKLTKEEVFNKKVNFLKLLNILTYERMHKKSLLI